MGRGIKQLAAHTLIYGLSTVLVRALNWLISPFHTYIFEESSFGVISEMYAYVAFLNVVFIYGMETAFFRFASKHKTPDNVFSTAFISLLTTTVLGVGVLILYSSHLASLLQYPGQGTLVVLFALIIGFDTMVSIPFARLRLKGKSLTYVAIKAINVIINISLNFLLLYPIWKGDYGMFGYVVSPQHAILYVFGANLAASSITFLLFLPQIVRSTKLFDKKLWKQMITYGWPFIITGLAGIVNETLDRILLKYLLPGTPQENLAQLGVYSAAYKLSVFMSLLVQAFRLGAEPFFFKQAAEKSAKETYAQVMNYFVFASLSLFLIISLNIDWIILILGEKYRSGKEIVPIVLMAYAWLGVFYNLSVWYKITDRTQLSIWIFLAGAGTTVLLNVWLIPIVGYIAAAWATFFAYAVMTVLSYLLSRKYYPIPYQIGKILIGMILAITFYKLAVSISTDHFLFDFLIRNSFFVVFLIAGYAILYRKQKPV